jgi:hypothetical protein
MGHKKPKFTTRAYLETAPLPKHGKTYTVVSHKEVIDHTDGLLKSHGFSIKKQIFRSNMNAKVAQGIYYITSDIAQSDEDLGMMFAWTNSYDKSTRFQCGIGAHVFVCNNGLIHGDLDTFARKHTGTANSEVSGAIATHIGKANHTFKELVTNKNDMKDIPLTITQQSELMGRLFVEEKLLDSQQMSCVKSEMEKASYEYGVGSETAWIFYNHVTHAFKQTHPRNWMENQAKFHKFMTSEILSAHTIKQNDTPNSQDIDVDNVDSNEEEIVDANNFFDM